MLRASKEEDKPTADVHPDYHSTLKVVGFAVPSLASSIVHSFKYLLSRSCSKLIFSDYIYENVRHMRPLVWGVDNEVLGGWTDTWCCDSRDSRQMREKITYLSEGCRDESRAKKNFPSRRNNSPTTMCNVMISRRMRMFVIFELTSVDC